jgi:2-dehydropantoate 2-reductase
VQSLTKSPLDAAFICVKSYDTLWAAELIRDYVKPDGFVVSLQNGLNEERIAKTLGWGRVLGCIASGISVNLKEPGYVERNIQQGGRHTVFRAGELHGRITPRLQWLVGLLAGVDSALLTQDLWGERWTKLVLNSMTNGVSAMTGLSGKALAVMPAARKLSIQLAAEAIVVGRALGFQIGLIQGSEPDLFVAAASGNAVALQSLEKDMLQRAERMNDAALASTAQDMAKGRRSEIDYINGEIVGNGEVAGVPADTHRALVRVVKEVESGTVSASPGLLERVEALARPKGHENRH